MQNTFNANSDGDDDSFSAAMEIVDNYQEWVEYHRGAVVIQEANSRSKEKLYSVRFTLSLLSSVKSSIGISVLKRIVVEDPKISKLVEVAIKQLLKSN